MIETLILAAALHTAPKPEPLGTPRYVWCISYRMAPEVWGDLGPLMHKWCRGIRL